MTQKKTKKRDDGKICTVKQLEVWLAQRSSPLLLLSAVKGICEQVLQGPQRA